MRAHGTAVLLLSALLCAQEQEAAQAPAAVPRPDAPALGIDLRAPAKVVPLPPALREVSALQALDDQRVACLQDEKGTLYEVDLATGALLGSRAFGPKGDYEGLTCTAEHWYALRSDGVLLCFPRQPGLLSRTEAFELSLPQKDCEALAADRDGTRLLVAPKARPEGDKEARDVRRVHAWDVATRELAVEPAWTLSVASLLEQAVAKGFATPTKKVKGGRKKDAEGAVPESREVPHLQLTISEIAVHPATGDLWILSSADKALVVVDRKGYLVHLHLFDHDLLPQPEALAFLPCGDLVVASEGKDAAAVVVRYARLVPKAAAK